MTAFSTWVSGIAVLGIARDVNRQSVKLAAKYQGVHAIVTKPHFSGSRFYEVRHGAGQL